MARSSKLGRELMICANCDIHKQQIENKHPKKCISAGVSCVIHRMLALNRALLGTGTGFFSVDWLALGYSGDGPCSLETLTYVCLSTSSMMPSDRIFDLKQSTNKIRKEKKKSSPCF